MARPQINTRRARELRASGLSWREVGVRLAKEERRRVPYQAPGVSSAVVRDVRAELASDYYRITGRKIER